METNDITVTTSDYFSNADGKGLQKVKDAFKPKSKSESKNEPAKVKRKDEIVKDGKTRKDLRIENREENKNKRFKKRLDKANAKLAPDAKPLTKETLPSRIDVFKGKIKALFKKKTKSTGGSSGGGSGGGSIVKAERAKEEEVYVKTLGNGETINIPADKVTLVPTKTGEPIAYHNDDIQEAKANGAKTIANPNTGELNTIYNEEDVIGLDDGNGNIEVYAPQDIEGEGKDKDGNSKEGIFTTKNMVIGGLVLLIGGGLIYFGLIRNKG